MHMQNATDEVCGIVYCLHLICFKPWMQLHFKWLCSQDLSLVGRDKSSECS